ncbi:Alpha/Beta hydrolase protein [Aspergillus pseudoustus]|uniref:Alpha/Beta hydrolase protein n=1 Tax=Aspergillus pseudoustus TaxID=1810923 RepID=A0ABR4JQ40_9EURO
MKSDLVLEPNRWQPQSVTKSTGGVCDLIRKGDEESAKIFGDVAAMRSLFLDREGQLPEAKNIESPSRDPGRLINSRVLDPSNVPSPTGIFLHFHGGGLVAGRHDSSVHGPFLHANASGCRVVSVDYRLAPEDSYPSGVDLPVTVIGGELAHVSSAGAFLTMQVIFHLLGTYPTLDTVKALGLAYGCYTWSFLPSVFTIPDPVCLNPRKMSIFRGLAMTPAPTITTPTLRAVDSEFGALQAASATDTDPDSDPIYDSPLKHPVFSPLYRRFDYLESIASRLPVALFVAGTVDPLVDDTVLMSARWQMAQGRAVTRFVPGAPHAFAEVPIESGDCCVAYTKLVEKFLDEVLDEVLDQ